MQFTFGVNQSVRKLLENELETNSLSDLNKIPDGFSNNIIWNIAHVIATQQLLIYKLSGLPMLVSEDFTNKYRNKTKPEGNLTQEEVNEIKALLLSTSKKTEADFQAGIFKEYHQYTVSYGTTLSNTIEAIAFNNFHEAIHYGYILALKKAL